MQTIQPVQPEDISRPARRLLDALDMKHGLSNMLKTMAHSPGTLEAYLEFNRELEEGPLGAMLAEKVALTVAQAENAEYSLAFHTVRARNFGINDDEILSIREGRVADKKTEVALRFARALSRRTGDYSVEDLRKAGYTDADIVAMIACVGLNSFANLFNIVAGTELDFPKVVAATKAA
jgi:alkylhydroperoxidase family enzyme